MVAADEIIRIADEIARQFHPERIILFGSYAYGSPTPDSDVDLLIVTNYAGKAYEHAGRILAHLGGFVDTEILVRNDRELHKRLALGDFFLREIVEKGIVLYDAANQRVGGQGRRRLRKRFDAVPKAKVA